MAEYSALIEYYFKKKITNIDDYAEYYEKLMFLSDKGVIDIKFKKDEAKK